jgi:HEAT repeat protein
LIALVLSLVLGSAPSAGPSGVPPVVLEELDALEQQLRDRDQRERRKAVQGLVQVGSPEAWELVLDALEDTHGQVADEAQLALPGLPVEMRGELFGKRGLGSRREIVALRVAEALGRMPQAPEASTLVKALGHKDPDVRRSLLWSIERLAARKELSSRDGALVDAVRDMTRKEKDARVRAQAVSALGALDPGAIQQMALEYVLAKEPEVRAAVAEMLRYLPMDRLGPSLGWTRKDPAPVVRMYGYDALAPRTEKAAMQLLATCLGEETSLRLRWRIVGHLRAASGLKHGLDPRPWQLWAEELRDGWKRASGARDLEEEAVTSSFAGLPLLSDRMSFLIDFSGSMWQERDGKTRKQRVDEALRAALEKLEAETSFNVFAFTKTVRSWKGSLTPARKKDVRKAIDWFEGSKDQGTGDYWAAMMEAAADPDVDTLILLGDGAPSGGARWNVELIRDLWRHENRYRGIAVDMVLVEANGRLAGLWKELCDQCGGRALEVDL